MTKLILLLLKTVIPAKAGTQLQHHNPTKRIVTTGLDPVVLSLFAFYI